VPITHTSQRRWRQTLPPAWRADGDPPTAFPRLATWATVCRLSADRQAASRLTVFPTNFQLPHPTQALALT